MFTKIINWLRENNVEITWFLIGFLFLAGLESFAKGDIITGLVDWGLVVVNYLLRPQK
tara:strand:+ start:581 stop:754 length:174 start_codon:yes stop_codon:yes gene_type:complete